MNPKKSENNSMEGQKMNAMVTPKTTMTTRYSRKKIARKPHLLESIDWQQYSVDEWLDQYGAWVQSAKSGRGSAHCTLAGLYTPTRGKKPKSKPMPMACNITDNEARAMMRLVMELGGWDAQVLIHTYEYGKSLKAVAYYLDTSVSAIRFSLEHSKGWLSGRVGMFRGERG